MKLGYYLLLKSPKQNHGHPDGPASLIVLKHGYVHGRLKTIVSSISVRKKINTTYIFIFFVYLISGSVYRSSSSVKPEASFESKSPEYSISS